MWGVYAWAHCKDTSLVFAFAILVMLVMKVRAKPNVIDFANHFAIFSHVLSRTYPVRQGRGLGGKPEARMQVPSHSLDLSNPYPATDPLRSIRLRPFDSGPRRPAQNTMHHSATYFWTLVPTAERVTRRESLVLPVPPVPSAYFLLLCRRSIHLAQVLKVQECTMYVKHCLAAFQQPQHHGLYLGALNNKRKCMR